MDEGFKEVFVRQMLMLIDEDITTTEIVNSLKESDNWTHVDLTLKKEFYKTFNIYKENIKTLVGVIGQIIAMDDHKSISRYEDIYALLEVKHRKLYHVLYDTMDTMEDLYEICYW
ncbi:hypothetical protein [Clostridium sp.]|uniref:hypothetical protein n=1 Tax=Clostridium sp. TaxID=1506 RepID=UPI003F2C602C